MQVLVKPNGERDKSYRPTINMEDTGRSVYLYDPMRPHHYGLYTNREELVYGVRNVGQNPCDSWRRHFHNHRYPTEVPRRGASIPLRKYTPQGGGRYETLLQNTRSHEMDRPSLSQLHP